LANKSLVFLSLLIAILLAGLTGCDSIEDRKAAHLQRGHELFAEGDLVKARLEFRNVLQIDSAHAESWFMMGQIAEEQEEWRNAYASYNKAIETDSNQLDSRIRLGHLLLVATDLDASMEQAEAVLSASANNPSGLALRGAVWLKRGDVDAALADAEAALQQEPSHLEALALLSQVRMEQDNPEAAKQVLEDALKAHPSEARFILGLAAISERLGDTAGTLAGLKRIIELEPKELAHRTRLAQYLAATGDAEGAEQTLREAVSALPEETEPKLALIQFISAQRGSDAAVTELQALISSYPADDDLRFLLADFYRETGDLEQAEGVFAEIIEVSEASASKSRAKGRLAALALADGRTDQARELVEQVLAEDNRNAEALRLRAALALQDGDADQAVIDLRTALRSDPDSVGALRLLAEAHLARDELALADDTLRQVIEAAPDDPASYLRLAGVRRQAGNLEGAEAILESLLQRDPGNGAAQGALAQVRQAQPDTEALARSAEEILTTRPDHPLGHYLTGLVEQRQGNAEASIAHLETALEKQPKAAEPLIALTRSLLALDRYDEAEQRLVQAQQDGADPVVTGNLLGELYTATEWFGKAKATYREMIKLRPGAPLAYERLARLQLAQGQTDAAVGTLQQGIDATEGSSLLTGLLPMALERAKRYDEAITAYETLLAGSPDNIAAANNLSMLLSNHRADDPTQAARALELAKPFDSLGNDALLDTLGWAYYRNGDFERAITILERSAAAGETSPERQYHLGMAYLKAGRVEEARPLLIAAAEASVPFTGQDQAAMALQTIP
jgi:tetratricopeptide (TPR) repeat protein